MGARGGLYFPIKLRCVDPAALLSNTELADAMARALGRSFARARKSLPADLAFGAGVYLQPACFEGSVPFDQDEQKCLLEIVDRAIQNAARAQALPMAKVERAAPLKRISDDGSSSGASEYAERPSEPFSPEQYDPLTANYEVPS